MKKHRKSKKFKFDKKYIIRSSAIILAVCVVFAVALNLLNYWENSNEEDVTVPSGNLARNTIEYEGKEYERKRNIETLLVMGLDDYTLDTEATSYNSEYEADFLMLFVFDHKNERFSAIHINRDMMTDMEKPHVDGRGYDTVNKQIALAYSYEDGGDDSCLNTTRALENVFADVLGSVEIKEYMSVTMNAVAVVNDAVDGVEVEVKDDFSGIDDTLIMGETVVLEGEHALNFVRERRNMEDSSNSTRMERQRQYLDALFKKGKDAVAANDALIYDTLNDISDMFVSSYNIFELENTIECIVDYEFDGFYTIDGTNEIVDGFVQFTPYKESVQQVVLDLFYDPVTDN